MPPSRPSRLRKVVGFAGVSTVALLGSAFFAGAASAHHPEVSVTTDCSFDVDFTSTAWAPATDAQRTNPEIGVAYKVDGGSFVALPQKAEYHYDKANGFSFSDELPALPAGWHEVTVKVTAIGQWGSGYQGPDSREASVIAPDDCAAPAQPSATIAEASCADHGAVVTLKNEGDTEVEFDVNGEKVTVGPNDTETKTVTFPGDTDTTITVTAPGMDDVVETVDYHCAAPAPSANVANATCADSGAIVHLVNGGDAPAEFTIQVPGSPDQTVTVPANSTSDETVTLLAGTTKTITVTADDMDDVTKDVSYTCTTPTPPVDNTPVVVPPAPEQPVFVAPELVAPIVDVPVVSAPVSSSAAAPATAEATPAPTSSIPGEVLAAEATAPAAAPSSATLPFTGSSTGPMTLTAFGSLLVGLAMAFAGRRRTTQQ
ncbi:MAG: hypothetical protein JWN67_2023 [Actinomycetia bacterium]|nr:hypothetical protein [Actinomycetes bacterium]